MQRHNPVLGADQNRPTMWFGVNYWSRVGGPRMWRDYSPEVVRQELAQLADLGLTTTRSFLYWSDFMPAPDVVDEHMLERFGDFLDAHAELGMSTIPSFVVGHMSGQNWDPAWRGGRDVFGAVWFVARTAWYIRQIVSRFGQHEAITGWLLSNEIPIYADPVNRGIGTLDHTLVTSWVEILVDAIRAAGGTQPVSVGDGAWGLEITGADNGFRLPELLPSIDFVGPHVYRMETDQVRQNLGAAFICELAGYGKPVVMEEFGVTSDYVEQEQAADYYRQILHNTFLAGATGWLAWNNCDYDDLRGVDPYRHHPHEMHFGIIDRNGIPKAQARELSAFARLATGHDFTTLQRPDAHTALVISSFLDTEHPFTKLDDSTAVFRNSLQSYVSAHEADLPVALARESAGIPDDAELYLLPSCKQLTAPGWDALKERVRSGATLYASASMGNHSTQRGLWWPDTDELFGVHRMTRYGVADRVLTDEVEFAVEVGFGSLKPGDTLRFRVGGTPDQRTMLPVEARGAQVLARDEQGRPAILRNQLGSGWAYLVTYPLEAFAAESYEVNPEDTWRIYDAIADEAGIERPVRAHDPRIAASVMEREDGERLVWFVNLSGDAVAVDVELGAGAEQSFELGPFAVRVVDANGEAIV